MLNGTVHGEYHYGGIAMYKCDKGFMVVNGNKQTCKYGGRWSQPTPYCKREYI